MTTSSSENLNSYLKELDEQLRKMKLGMEILEVDGKRAFLHYSPSGAIHAMMISFIVRRGKCRIDGEVFDSEKPAFIGHSDWMSAPLRFRLFDEHTDRERMRVQVVQGALGLAEFALTHQSLGWRRVVSQVKGKYHRVRSVLAA